MKTYLLLALLFPLTLRAFPNEELHNLYERTVRSACYKAGAVSGISAFVGGVIANGIILYMLSPQQSPEGR